MDHFLSFLSRSKLFKPISKVLYLNLRLEGLCNNFKDISKSLLEVQRRYTFSSCYFLVIIWYVFLDALFELFSSRILGIFFVLILDDPGYYNFVDFPKCFLRFFSTIHTTIYTNIRTRFFELVKFDGCRFNSLVYVDFLKYLPQLTHR